MRSTSRVHELAVHELQHLARELVHVDAGVFLLAARALLHEQPQVMDELARALVLLGDLREDGTELRDVGGIGGEEAQRRLCIGEDGGERLVELVGERAESSVSAATRVRCVSCMRCSRASCSARRCSVMSRAITRSRVGPALRRAAPRPAPDAARRGNPAAQLRLAGGDVLATERRQAVASFVVGVVPPGRRGRRSRAASGRSPGARASAGTRWIWAGRRRGARSRSHSGLALKAVANSASEERSRRTDPAPLLDDGRQQQQGH